MKKADREQLKREKMWAVQFVKDCRRSLDDALRNRVMAENRVRSSLELLQRWRREAYRLGVEEE